MGVRVDDAHTDLAFMGGKEYLGSPFVKLGIVPFGQTVAPRFMETANRVWAGSRGYRSKGSFGDSKTSGDRLGSNSRIPIPAIVLSLGMDFPALFGFGGRLKNRDSIAVSRH